MAKYNIKSEKLTSLEYQESEYFQISIMSNHSRQINIARNLDSTLGLRLVVRLSVQVNVRPAKSIYFVVVLSFSSIIP